METQIEYFVVNTENGTTYAVVEGIKRTIQSTNNKKYCFTSKNKILDKTISLSHFSKNGKFIDKGYLNIFNDVDQKRIEDYLNN